MDLTTRSIEQFVAGAEEIDRKRQVIKRVLNAVTSLLEKSPKNASWGTEEVLVSVHITGNEFRGAIGPIKIRSLGENESSSIAIEITVPSRIKSRGRLNITIEEIPYRLVPLIYDHLPRIIKEADETDPKASIAEHFQFFINQAPDA